MKAQEPLQLSLSVQLDYFEPIVKKAQNVLTSIIILNPKYYRMFGTLLQDSFSDKGVFYVGIERSNQYRHFSEVFNFLDNTVLADLFVMGTYDG